MSKKRSICIVGLGYIGLPTAALLASHGYKVHGVDVNWEAVKKINNGEAHIYEPGLDACVKSAIESGLLSASTEIVPSDVYMICVPTPFKDGEAIPEPDLSFIETATKSIAPYVKAGDLVILESTSPVGTTESVEQLLSDGGVATSEISIAYCPERVLPGNIMTELIENDRIVGGVNQGSTNAIVEFYEGFINGSVISTSARTAEMCKLTENSFRDVNIAFANELSVICDRESIDVWELIGLANRHPRVNVLSPGTGVGGHCIAVDPWFIVSRNPEDAKLIKTARDVNDEKPELVVQKIASVAKERSKILGRPARIGCLGLSFKPDIDDLRESPALQVTRRLMNLDYEVAAAEPNVESVEGINLVDANTVLSTADVIAVLVAHKQFKNEPMKRKLQAFGSLDFCGLLTVGQN
jgi:UDP-N-acetyl-D-mannosaminuronic acid dehydrogenase